VPEPVRACISNCWQKLTSAAACRLSFCNFILLHGRQNLLGSSVRTLCSDFELYLLHMFSKPVEQQVV
jgi:hypothetical protein